MKTLVLRMNNSNDRTFVMGTPEIAIPINKCLLLGCKQTNLVIDKFRIFEQENLSKKQDFPITPYKGNNIKPVWIYNRGANISMKTHGVNKDGTFNWRRSLFDIHVFTTRKDSARDPSPDRVINNIATTYMKHIANTLVMYVH